MKTVTALVPAALVLALAAGCGGPFRDHGSYDYADVDAHATKRVVAAMDRLDATDAQKREALVLKDGLLLTAKPLIEDKGALKAALLAEWKAASPDAAKVHGTVDAKLAQVTAVAHKAADAMIKLHGILTPEQRAKVTSRIEY
jgi:Spy/CpxP family protein refolding chaperone